MQQQQQHQQQQQARSLHATRSARRDELIAAAEALLAAKDNQMETAREWRRLRRAIKLARKSSG